MRAVQATSFGAPSVLTVAELPDPSPGPGEVAIDVTHAAVGLIDILLRQGTFRDQPGMPQPPFIPGLEIAGTVRALGPGVSGLAIGEQVISMSAGAGTGGYAALYIAPFSAVASIQNQEIDPAVAVSVIPNAAMAHVALTRVLHLTEGETVLVNGGLGGFAAAFPGIARTLGASRVVGTVRPGKMAAAAATKLPYDAIVDSTDLAGALGQEKFAVIIDPVGGSIRTQSLDHLKVGGRLLAAGNASSDWTHQIDDNRLWLGSITISGFNAGAYLPAHPQFLRPALEAAVQAVADGLGQTEVDVLPFSEAATAHQRVEDRKLNGRIALTP